MNCVEKNEKKEDGVLNNEDIFSRRLQEIDEARDYLWSKTKYRPKIAIICGTGLGALTEELTDSQTFPYSDIPHFVATSVKGHSGCLVFGKFAGQSVVCMKGRIHSFEGHPMWKMTFMIRVFSAMGIRALLATNAAGSINMDYNVGDLMIIKDHINIPGLSGLNPMIGLNDERFGTRFPSMSDAYDREFMDLLVKLSKELGFDFVRQGVYVYQTGPCFETIAESRLMKILGADVAGMSTVPEILVARHCHIRCMAMSVVTNKCIMDYDSTETVQHDAVLTAGDKRTKQLVQLLMALMPKVAAQL